MTGKSSALRVIFFYICLLKEIKIFQENRKHLVYRFNIIISAKSFSYHLYPSSLSKAMEVLPTSYEAFHVWVPLSATLGWIPFF